MGSASNSTNEISIENALLTLVAISEKGSNYY